MILCDLVFPECGVVTFDLSFIFHIFSSSDVNSLDFSWAKYNGGTFTTQTQNQYMSCRIYIDSGSLSCGQIDSYLFLCPIHP